MILTPSESYINKYIFRLCVKDYEIEEMPKGIKTIFFLFCFKEPSEYREKYIIWLL